MDKKFMNIEEQVWNDLCGRKLFCTPRQISRKLMVPISTVRTYLIRWHNQHLLDLHVVGKQTLYRIKE